MANFLEGLDHFIKAHALAVIVSVRIKNDLLIRKIIKFKRGDDQLSFPHFSQIIIRFEMVSPLLREGDLSALGAPENLAGHRKVRKYVSKYIVRGRRWQVHSSGMMFVEHREAENGSSMLAFAPMDSSAPLAYRLRPKNLQEFFGQTEVVGQGTPLRRAIEQDLLTSVIFGGPPGTGKTTLAKIIAEATKAQFVQLNAVTSGVKDIKEVCAQAEQLRTLLHQRTVLFIDEIHCFNKSQQDALLPSVESGVVILIGATTENPYFSVNSALISRSQVYLLKPHSVEDLEKILERALTSSDGYNGNVTMHPDAIRKVAELGNGDARIALNLLELAVLMIGTKITREDAEKLLKQRSMRYDKKGEDHYDTISAFIKSMRGSDVDASLLWMYKMLASGEEPRFLFRRMSIFASEDIGNADPRALQIVVSAWQVFEMVGMPEAEYFLAHACVYLAQAPKSNAVTRAMGSAKSAVQSAPALEVPMHLRNAPVKAMAEKHGYHKGYQYPHNAKDAVVNEEYFPIGYKGQRNFYEPSERGFEAEVRERMEWVRSTLQGTTGV